MAFRLAVEHLAGCSGCELAWLDAGPALRERLDQVDLVRLPLLADLERRPDGRAAEPGALDAALVSGAIRTEAHLALAQDLRAKAATLVAVGTCAAHGGLPALANLHPLSDLQADQGLAETAVVPPLLPRVYALEERVRVDRKSTRLNSSHNSESRMPSSA
jgi:F420-non-reducing hydrogenase small subunit